MWSRHLMFNVQNRTCITLSQIQHEKKTEKKQDHKLLTKTWTHTEFAYILLTCMDPPKWFPLKTIGCKHHCWSSNRYHMQFITSMKWLLIALFSHIKAAIFYSTILITASIYNFERSNVEATLKKIITTRVRDDDTSISSPISQIRVLRIRPQCASSDHIKPQLESII